jgi:TetR/AcrR family transcriptional regulator, tetracycline repressor protein
MWNGVRVVLSRIYWYGVRVSRSSFDKRGRRSQAARAKGRVTLSREDVLTEAAQLLDREGVDGLSMRKLAAALGTGAATLYWHVQDKDQLLVLILDHTLERIAIPTQGSWRARLFELVTSLREAIRSRPVLARVVMSAGWKLGPEALRIANGWIGLIAESGLPEDQVSDAYFGVLSFTLGFIECESRMPGNATFGEELSEAQVAELAAMAARFPHLLRYGPGTDREGMDRRFRYGLERMIDGIAARAEHAPTPKGSLL